MKTAAVFSAVLSLLSLGAAAGAGSQKSSLFKPPQVFKNANLVHVISVEKNYVKENINVLVENIDKAAHDEYYLPFSADQLARLGGVEVKDRKDTAAGPFVAEAVESNQARYGWGRKGVCFHALEFRG
jgi:oligosaccharyltransferase complex subunit alpha (ribophorin I)